MEECRCCSINDEINIEITSDYYMNDLEKDKLVDMIRSNFGNEISEMLFYRKRSVIYNFIMLGFGIFSLIIYLIISNIPILSEFILVFSWILIWESAYNLIFTGLNNKIEIERKRKITNCKILFK